MQKFLTRLLIVVMVVVLLSSTMSAAAQDEPVTLNLWTFLDDGAFLPAVIEAFQAQYPHITVQLTDVPEDEFVTKVDTAILAGQPPDLGFPYVRRWIKAGLLLPLNDVFAAQNINIEDYNAGAISRNCLIDGQLYCVGSYTGGTALFYNKDLFDAAGIPYPSATESMTIDEYAALVQQLYTPSDNLEEQVWGGSAPSPFWNDPANYYTDDGRGVMGDINDEATVHYYQVAADLISSGAVLVESETSAVSPDDLLATGQLAMTVSDTVIIQPLMDASGIRWGAAPPPVEKEGDVPWVYTGSDELAAFKGSAHPEEAMLFLAFYGSMGNQIRLDLGGLPLNMRMAEDQNWAGDNEGRQEMFAAVQISRPTIDVPDWYFVFDYLSEALNGLMLIDGLSAQEALDETAPIVQDELDLKWETWEAIQPIQ
jgi:multiple sugar transport system substrate-binding protein